MKYYWISFQVYGKLDGKRIYEDCISTHPFIFINDNNIHFKRNYIYKLLNFREISKLEHDYFKKFITKEEFNKDFI